MTHRYLRMPALLIASAALLLAACGSGFESESAAASEPRAPRGRERPAEPGADLTILIGSSGDAETDIVKTWSPSGRPSPA